MQNFTSELDIRYLEGDDYVLLSDFSFYYYWNHSSGKCVASLDNIEPFELHLFHKITLVVPRGFITDFASVPAALQCILSKTGRYGKAAVIHDYIYRCAGQAIRMFEQNSINPTPQAIYFSENDGYKYSLDRFFIEQKEADSIFNIAMEILDVKPWRQTLLYYGVKWFGHFTFDSHLARNNALPLFEVGANLVPLDFRISIDQILPLFLEVKSVRRNLLTFEGVKGEYINYNFKHANYNT